MIVSELLNSLSLSLLSFVKSVQQGRRYQRFGQDSICLSGSSSYDGPSPEIEMSSLIPVDLSLAESPHPNAILCHKCKALLGSRCRQDRVNQESKEAAEDGLPLQRLVDSEAVAREMVTSDLIEITALEGCTLCLLLMDCLLSDDLTAMREHWERSKEDPNYAPFLVRYELYADREQLPFLSVEYEPPQIDLAPRNREIKAMVQLHTEIGKLVWHLLI